MKLDKVTQPGGEDAADYISERDKKYCTSELIVPAVLQPQTDDHAVAPVPSTFGELMQCLQIVPGISQMPQGSFRPGCSHMRLGAMKPPSNTSISGLEPTAERDTLPLLKAKPDEPVSFYRCI